MARSSKTLIRAADFEAKEANRLRDLSQNLVDRFKAPGEPGSAANNREFSEEVWLELECLSLKEEARRLSASLDQTLDHIKSVSNSIIHAH